MKPTLSACILAVSMIFVLNSPSVNAQTTKPSSAAPPSASSTASFESQMLAYGGLQHVANALGKTVCGVAGVDADNSVVIIYDQTAFASLQLYEAFVANIQVVSSAYQMLIPSNDLQNAMRSLFDEHAKAFEGLAQREASPGQKDLYEYKSKRFALSLAPIIDPFADAASLISAIAIASNTETPGQVTIPDSALAVALTRRMKTECHHKVTIVYPPMFGSGSSSDYASADIQVAIQKLDDIRSIAQKSVSTANQAYLRTYPLQATSATAVTKGKSATDQTANTDTKQTMFAAISADPVLTAALTDINGLYDSFVNSLLQVNASTGMIGSASVIQGYRLAKLLRGTQCEEDNKNSDGACPTPTVIPTDRYSTWTKRPAYVLLASVLNAGGTQHDHKTLWTALSSGDQITYSGGVVVNASLWSTGQATPLYVDVLRYRAPFSDLKAPTDISGLDDGDNLK